MEYLLLYHINADERTKGVRSILTVDFSTIKRLTCRKGRVDGFRNVMYISSEVSCTRRLGVAPLGCGAVDINIVLRDISNER